MKVYLATAGEYSDYRVCHVFANREDAENYQIADSVTEREVLTGPVEVRTFHHLVWNPARPDRGEGSMLVGNPWIYGSLLDFPGGEQPVRHQWITRSAVAVLEVTGWDRETIMKVYREQRYQHQARQVGIT